MVAERKRWQFLWHYDHEPTSEIRSKVFRAATLERACNKMVEFIESKQWGGIVHVDYEARAEHVQYREKRHREKFPSLAELEHPIREYVWNG